jgi:hypothetical protein
MRRDQNYEMNGILDLGLPEAAENVGRGLVPRRAGRSAAGDKPPPYIV